MLDNFRYIAYQLGNPIAAINIAAINTVKNIKNKIYSLDFFPYRGAYYSSKFSKYLIYKNYLIFYKIHEKEKIIIIKRIIHKNVNI